MPQENNEHSDDFLETVIAEELKKRFSSQRQVLANKLLDLSGRNPLIRTTFRSSKTATSTQLRFVHDPLEQIYSAISSESPIEFEAIQKPKGLPKDEDTVEFKSKLETFRLEDDEYKIAMNKLGPDASERAIEKIDRDLRDKVRVELKMPKLKATVSVDDVAAEQGVNSSYELPKFDFENSSRVRMVSKLQTLKYPEDLDRSLRQIYSQAKLRESETGINFLTMTFGFLEWYSADSADKANFSPIVISPVRIEKKTEGKQQTYFVSQESEATLNICLSQKLKTDFGLLLPEFNSEDKIELYLKTVNELIKEKKNWRIRNYSLLGFYSFAKLVMHRDLLESGWDEEAANNGILKELYGSTGLGQGSVGSDYDVDQKNLRQICPALPLPADGSQISSIIDVIQGSNLALEGPPGTGKSQTIANLITALVAKGKSVLFVAEKKAALDVVKSRLDKEGLGDICLELHSSKTKKSDIAKTLIEKMKRRKAVGSNSYENLFNVIDQLNERSNLLNVSDGKVDTVFRRIGKYLLAGTKNKKLSDIPDQYRIATPANNSDERKKDAVVLFAKAFEFLSRLRKPELVRNHPWINIIPRLKRTAIDEAENEFKEINELLKTMRADLMSSKMKSIKDHEWSLEELLICYKTIDSNALTVPDSNILNAIANNVGQEKALGFIASIEKLKQLDHKIFDSFGITSTKLLSIDYEEYREIYKQIMVRGWGRYNRLSLRKHSAELKKNLGFIDESQKWLHDTALLFNVENLQGQPLEINSLSIIVKSAVTFVSEGLSVGYPLMLLSEAGSLKTVRLIDAKVKKLHSLRLQLKLVFDLKSAPNSKNVEDIADVLTRKGWFWWADKEGRAALRKANLFRYKKTLIGPNKLIAELRLLDDYLTDKEKIETDKTAMSLAGDYWDGIETDFGQIVIASEAATNARKNIPSTDLGRKALAMLFGDDREACKKLSELSKKTGFDVLDEVLSFFKTDIGSEAKDINGLSELITEKIKPISKLLAEMETISFPEEMELEQLKTLLDFLRETKETLAVKQVWYALCESKQVPKNEFTDPKTVQSFLNYVKCVEELKLLPTRKLQLLEPEGPSVFFYLRDYLLSNANQINKLNSFNDSFGPALKQSVSDYSTMGFQKLLIWLNVLVASTDEIKVVDQYLRIEQSAKDLLGSNVLELIEKKSDLRSEIPVVLDYLWFRSELFELMANSPHLKNHGYPNKLVRELYDLDDASRKEFVSKLLFSVKSKHIPEGEFGPSVKDKTDLNLLQHQAGLMKRHVEIRDLMNRAGSAVKAITPCLLMSPMSVATYFPSKSLRFDVVVMDEASQVKTEDALGAILRGKQLVVVGDDKQLPPTSFFWLDDSKDVSDEEEDDTDGFDSILEYAFTRLKNRRTLRWHYRSKHHSLIAYSNNEFYNRNLILPPSPYTKKEDLGIKYVYVNDHVYSGRKNLQEAKAVLDLVLEHVKTSPDRSLGIVSLNSEHRILLEDLLREEELVRSELSSFIEKQENAGQPLFVKNLENVQGDERDCIIVSTVYGKDADRNFFQRFGPINNNGGHRRLNVLFTRSRYKTTIVTSIEPEKINISSSSSRGVRVLKEYLQYARSGKLPNSDNSELNNGRQPANEFEESIIESLRTMGFDCVPQYGESGFFIDIAIRDPKNPGKFLGGIECDGASYHSVKSARDRDRLRQEILEQQGWSIHRVWSTDWFHDLKNEEQKMKNTVQSWIKN